MAAFNDTDLRVYKAFVERYAPTLGPYVDDDLSVREVTGGCELLSAEIGEGTITATVKDRAWDRRSRVVLSAKGADHLEDISFLGAPGGDTEERLDDATLIDRVHTKLGAEGAAGRFSGTTLIGRGEKVLLRVHHGFADEAKGVSITPSTRFCIGSMGKLFTAVAVMQLVEQGRLSLSDPLLKHLTDYPNRSLAEQVTIERLLTHTGGTGDIFGPPYDPAVHRTPSDILRLYGARDPAFPPGSRWGYSNYGFVLLGAVIERLEGRPFDAVIAERIFAPAGMTKTSQGHASPYRTALPYTGAAATRRRPLTPYDGLPAGGGYSTVEDLHGFATALRRGRLMKPETLRDMLTPRVAAGAGRWALGVPIRERGGLTYWGHGGSAPGVNADLAVYGDKAVVVLANRGHPAAAVVADFIGARISVGSDAGQAPT
jgi:CubicO group peptidase (beta-lactamase class C family)